MKRKRALLVTTEEKIHEVVSGDEIKSNSNSKISAKSKKSDIFYAHVKFWIDLAMSVHLYAENRIGLDKDNKISTSYTSWFNCEYRNITKTKDFKGEKGSYGISICKRSWMGERKCYQNDIDMYLMGLVWSF